MNSRKLLTLKNTLLLMCSGGLLVAGGLSLYKTAAFLNQNAAALTITQTQNPLSQPEGKFVPQGMNRFEFSEAGKALFSLMVAHYLDEQQVQRSVILFPQDQQEGAVFTTPTGLRAQIWQAAMLGMTTNAAKDALFLSWWDDGQRVNFLGGGNAWLSKPAEPTFAGPVWKALQPELLLASAEESKRLSRMAVWLTMDSEKALAEMSNTFGTAHPIYLLVTNDLLLRQGELMAYGGSPLVFNSKNIPAGDDLHGDIAQVKRWAAEAGEGDYLVQKEGQYYRTWSPANLATKNSLLVRLLPFMDSLKKLPQGIQLVYQSGGGGYLSVYKLGEN